MREQFQVNMRPALASPTDVAQRASTAGSRVGRELRNGLAVVALGLLCGVEVGMLTSTVQASAAKAEVATVPVAARPSAVPAATVFKTPDAPGKAAVVPVASRQMRGDRYRVNVETAYFFDEPMQSTPNGRYLRRGDTFYGEGELNGFVRTSFQAPNGERGTGWLKAQGLSKLSNSPAATAVVNRPRTAARPPKPKPSETTVAVVSAPTTPRASTPAPTPARVATPPTAPVPQPVEERPSAAPAMPEMAAVQAERAYFHDTPDLSTPRKAFCQRGDRVRLVDARGDAIYVTFTNWQGVRTRGWMKRDALDFN